MKSKFAGLFAHERRRNFFKLVRIYRLAEAEESDSQSLALFNQKANKELEAGRNRTCCLS